MSETVYDKYTQLANNLGKDKFESYLINEIDKIDDELAKIASYRSSCENYYLILIEKKNLLSHIRENYYLLKD